MTDFLGSANLQTSASAQTDEASVGYDGSTDAVVGANDQGVAFGGTTQHGLDVETDHAGLGADVGGSVDGAVATDGDVSGAADVAGGFEAVLDAMEDLWASVSGSISAALGL